MRCSLMQPPCSPRDGTWSQGKAGWIAVIVLAVLCVSLMWDCGVPWGLAYSWTLFLMPLQLQSWVSSIPISAGCSASLGH